MSGSMQIMERSMQLSNTIALHEEWLVSLWERLVTRLGIHTVRVLLDRACEAAFDDLSAELLLILARLLGWENDNFLRAQDVDAHCGRIVMSRGGSIRGLTDEGPGSRNTSVARARSSIRTARSTTGQGPVAGPHPSATRRGGDTPPKG
jgi:hypothetical protein